ncbi:hypothetical protein [Nonomuraea mesophila]|uniref:hypothetical protein n=1 Tax=Nonomuraea mesophila TaxID=2530382 RepID=UPI00140B07FB|nr:hypothetical protein [Nonomuraea mesophila]
MGALPNADTAMRPQLRDDVRFVECPDGAYVHSDYGACTLRGRQAYAWLARLAPALTGRHTLAELTAHLPDDRRAMVERLVGRLAEQRFVVDARQARSHGLTAAELREYAEEIAFIGYALDSPEARFERIRRAQLVLTGSGPLLEALVGACAGSGWRRITVICPAPEAAGRAADAARRDPAQEISTLASTHDTGLPGRAITGDADVLLQVSGDLDELVATARACEAASVVLGQALVGPAEVWLGQVGQPAATAVESGWHRLAGLPSAAPAPPDEDLLTGPVPTVVAAMQALAGFAHVAGLDTDTERRLTRVDLRTLDTLPHRFLAHPRAGARRTPDTLPHRLLTDPRAGARPGARSEAIGELTDALAAIMREDETPAAPGPAADRAGATQAGPAPALEQAAATLDAEGLLGLTSELVGSRLGAIGLLDEQALAQSPLAVCQAVVSDPFGALPGWAPSPLVHGWGPDQRTARLRCLLAALATYGLLALGPGEEAVWGVELPGGRPRPVPRAALRLDGSGTPRAPLGTGAGLSWPEALAAGLRAHCEHLPATHLPAAPDDHTSSGATVTHTDSGATVTHAGPGVTAAHAGPGATAARAGSGGTDAEALLRQLALAGESPRIRDLTTALGVPAVALTPPGREALVSAAATVPDARRDGLERLLLRWQSRTSRQHAYAGARPLWPPDGDPSQAVRTMAGALRRAGKVPVAVPLDGDPEAARLLPFVLRVVLVDD